MSAQLLNTITNSFRWVCCGSRRVPRRCYGCSPCEDLVLKYSWGSGSRDLDTGTTFLDETVGWSCGNNATYLSWSGDDTSEDGTETIVARIQKAYDDGLWTSSVTIECAAGWYIPAGGSGPATLSVTFRGETRMKEVSPGSQSDCATTHVATITIFDDGSWSLT